VLLAELPPAALEESPRTWSVPPSLAALVRHRLARLPQPSRALLESLAVFEEQVPLSLVGQVADVAHPAEALEPLLDAGLVDWTPTDPMTPVRISHPLYRDVVYRDTAPLRRRALHSAAVPLVDEDTAWTHRVAATDRVDAKLAAELEQHAIARIESGGSVDQTATWLEWASTLSDTREERERRLTMAVARLFIDARHHDRVLRLEPAVRACAPGSMRSAILSLLGLWGSDRKMSEALLREALTTATGVPGMEAVVATATMWLASELNFQDRGEDAIVAARRALEVSTDPLTEAFAGFLILIGRLISMGPRAALRHEHEEEALGMVPARSGIAAGLRSMMLSIYRAQAGEPSAALVELQQVTSVLGTLLADEPERQLALCHYALGHWTQAGIHAERALAIVEAEQRPWTAAAAHMAACLAAAGRGEWDRAEEHQRGASLWVQVSGVDSRNAYPATASAAIAQARGDFAGIVTALDVRWMFGSGTPVVYQGVWRPLHAEGLLGTGRLDEAARAVAELAELRADIPNLHTAVAWLSGWLAAERGDFRTARSLFEDALSKPAGPDDQPLHRALLAHEYGKRLLASGDRRAAVAVLMKAQTDFATLGAKPFLERIAADLARCGIAPETVSSDVAATLSGRERQVVHLVANGLTNQQVARDLYVSVKTVEYHLSHAYAKLGVSHRHELRRQFAGTLT
jgi:DNA-binding CsgD family transcriptional regulator